MPQTRKERDLEILNFKINQYNETLENFIKYEISVNKINKITLLRDRAIVSRDAIVATPDY
jgi:hypothetical protein